MSLSEAGIQHKTLGETLVAVRRCQFGSRAELRAILADVAQSIPAGVIAGPAFCVYLWISSVTDGDEGDVGFPVSRPVETALVHSRVLPAMQVLSLVHHGPVERIRETLVTLFGRAYQHGLISDEFMREVYLDGDNPEGDEIELQFVLHDWAGLLDRHVRRVLGEAAGAEIMEPCAVLGLESGGDERFRRVKEAIERLNAVADATHSRGGSHAAGLPGVGARPAEQCKYDAVSSCAHVFPDHQIARLRQAYLGARAAGADHSQAVDAVLDLMASDPCWGERPRREGWVIYSSKKPRDPRAHAAATTRAERARAYCFCPIIRTNLEEGMPPTFCYCGSGWYRRQWEGALGQPVRIEIVESLLKGDEQCTFAILLPEGTPHPRPLS